MKRLSAWSAWLARESPQTRKRQRWVAEEVESLPMPIWSPSSDIDQLCWERIGQFLDWDDILLIGRVCKQWRGWLNKLLQVKSTED